MQSWRAIESNPLLPPTLTIPQSFLDSKYHLYLLTDPPLRVPLLLNPESLPMSSSVPVLCETCLVISLFRRYRRSLLLDRRTPYIHGRR